MTVLVSPPQISSLRLSVTVQPFHHTALQQVVTPAIQTLSSLIAVVLVHPLPHPPTLVVSVSGIGMVQHGSVLKAVLMTAQERAIVLPHPLPAPILHVR